MPYCHVFGCQCGILTPPMYTSDNDLFLFQIYSCLLIFLWLGIDDPGHFLFSRMRTLLSMYVVSDRYREVSVEEETVVVITDIPYAILYNGYEACDPVVMYLTPGYEYSIIMADVAISA